MRLQVVSDLHYEMRYTRVDPIGDVLVIAGDLAHASQVTSYLTASAQLWKHVVYVPGNHEYYGLSVEAGNALLKRELPSNVHVLINESVTIEGQRFVGSTLWSQPVKLWSDGRHIEGCTREAMCGWNAECREYLAGEVRAGDVVVTHFMPVMLEDLLEAGHVSPYTPDPVFDVYFGNGGIDLSLAKLWVFGHTHNAIDICVRGTRLVCNPVGYPGEMLYLDKVVTL